MNKRLEQKVLAELKDEQAQVLLYTRNGVQMRGRVVDFDEVSLRLECEDGDKLVYLAFLSTIERM